MKFTDSKIKGLKPKEKRVTLFEDTGLGLRISPTGRKTFVHMYRHNGKQTMLTIGKYPLFSLSRARLEVANLKETVGRGVDPSQGIKAKKIAHNTAPTVEELVFEYIEKHAKLKKKSWKEDNRILNREVVSLWGDLKAQDIKRRDIVLLLDDIVDRGSPVTANRTLAAVRKMFNFAISRSILEASPCVQIEKPAKEKPRERVLNEKELKIFWDSLEQASMTKGIKLALKFLLVVGQRRVEVTSATWAEFDLLKGWWTLPGGKTKNGLLHRVPLTKMALEIMKRVKELSGESPHLFPAPGGNKPITERAVTKAVRKNEDIFGLPHFTPHDLRRTVYTLMIESGINEKIVPRVFNHIEKGVKGVYNKHSYDHEKRQAMDTWSRKLESILTGKPTGKIVELKR